MRYCLLLSIPLFEACAPVFYTPVTPLTPAFRYKNEVQAQLAIGDNDAGTEKIHASFAYAFDSNWAASGSVSLINRSSYMNEGYFGNASLVDFSGGYFNRFRNTRFGFEAFGGFQLGQAQVHHSDNYLSYQFIKPFVQGDVNYRTRVFEMVYFMKFGYFTASNMRLMQLNTAMEMHESFGNFMNSPYLPTFEQGFSMRIGYKGMKFCINYFFMSDMMSSNRGWAYGMGGASIGLNMDLNWLLKNGRYREELFRRPLRQ